MLRHVVLAAWLLPLAAASVEAEQPASARLAEDGPPRTDRYSDPLPPGARARLGTERMRPGHAVRLVACLADGKRLLSVGAGQQALQVDVWEAATGKRLRSFGGPFDLQHSASISADGKALAITGYDRRTQKNRVALWDLEAGKEKALPDAGIEGTIAALAPDGRALVTAGGDQILRLWDLSGGAAMRRFKGPQERWYRLVFSSDGRVVASVSPEGWVRLWDVAQGKELFTLPRQVSTSAFVAFSPDGKTLATAEYNGPIIRLWDWATAKEVRQLQGGKGTSCLAFSPDGKLLATGDSRDDSGQILRRSTIRLWDLATGKELRRFPGHLFGVDALAFTADSRRLLSVGVGNVLRLWDIATGTDLLPFSEHESYVRSVGFSADGRTLATGGLDGRLRLWEAATGKPIRWCAEGHPQRVWQVTFSPDGRQLASAGDDGTRLWDPTTGKEVRRLNGHDGDFRVQYRRDGRTLVTGGRDGAVRLWDGATGEERGRITREGKGYPACFSPDGRMLAWVSLDSGEVRLWDLMTRTEVRKIGQLGFGIVAFSPDGRTLARLSAGPLPHTLGSIQLWDLATNKGRGFAVKQETKVFAAAFSPDGRTLAWGDEGGTVCLAELATSQVRRRLQGHPSPVQCLAFSPDGKTLASGRQDTTALLWDLTAPVGDGGGRARAFSPQELKAVWASLAEQDAAKAYDAICALTASPEHAVPFLREHLRPVVSADAKQLARLVADLSSAQFGVRDKATQELEELGELANPALRKALEGQPALEVRRRVERLLEKQEGPVTAPDTLRALRAVETLEHIGGSEARQALQELARGAPEARLTREARESLDRLSRSAAGKP
jgi:WD40 repeat protein